MYLSGGNYINFDGHNCNSVVILDNCSVHHVSGVSDAIGNVGALPSPDYNLIELMIKVELSETMDIETIVLAAFSTVTVKHG